MNAIATPPVIPDNPDSPRSRPDGAERSAGAPAPSVNPHHRGGRILFEVPFVSALGAADLARLARMLDISTHIHPKMRPDPNSPGVVRLDHYSGLFLERDTGDGRWLLQARTWGRPAADTVHEWHLLAAQAARQLDPRVILPAPLADGRAQSLPGCCEGWIAEQTHRWSGQRSPQAGPDADARGRARSQAASLR